MYGVRGSCDRSPDKNGPLCDKQVEGIAVWLNDGGIKKELGANPGVMFNVSSEEVHKDFLSSLVI